MTSKKDYEISKGGNALLGTMRASVLAQLENDYRKMNRISETIDSTMCALAEGERNMPDKIFAEALKIKSLVKQIAELNDKVETELYQMWSKKKLSLAPNEGSIQMLDAFSYRKGFSPLYDGPMTDKEFKDILEGDKKAVAKQKTRQKRKKARGDSMYVLTDEESEMLDRALRESEGE